MFTSKTIQKIAVATLFAFAVQVSIASISAGISDERSKDNKYTLKNLALRSHKFVSISALKSELLFSGSQIVTQKNNGSEINSIMHFDRGNTTYVFPYKFKVKVPKFKTPAPPAN